MERNMDLVREILLAIESGPSGYAPAKLEISDYTEEQIGYHVYIMMQAGLLEGVVDTPSGNLSPTSMAMNLTWQGHEFLDACRDLSRWEKAKNIARKMGGSTINMLGQILTKVMMNELDTLMP